MKKVEKIKIIFLCALSLLLANACTKNFEELNTDPKLVTDKVVDVNLIFTNVEASYVPGQYGNGTYGSFCGMCNRDDDGKFIETDAPGQWNATYGDGSSIGIVNNLSNIIQLIESKDNKDDLVNKTAITRILKAWGFSILTDTYGDVPYSESCLPAAIAILSPKYDTQESIYKDLFKELKEAAAQLDATKESYGDADLVYGGDVVKWNKLANSLRLRLALRVRYVDAALATAQLSDLTEDDLLTTLSDDAFVKNNTDYSDHVNPRYFRIVNYGTISESVHTHMTMINILRNDSIHLDPRIKIYADTVKAPFKGGISQNGYSAPNWDYRGAPTTGDVDVEYKYPWGTFTTSDISDLWRVPVVACAIMKCSEVYFSLAEAKLAGLLPASFSGSANDYYQKGIDASIDWYKWFYDLTAPQIPALMKDFLHNPKYATGDQWTDADVQQYLEYKKIKDADITAFKSTPIYSLHGTDEEQLEMIINQKIVAIYPDEFQGWCEYRRTGYPKLPIVTPEKGALHGVIPRREPWPTQEETLNSASFKEALLRYGTDSRMTKIWWDANPNAPHVYEWTAPSMPKAWQ
jgi:hypothetical protein